LGIGTNGQILTSTGTAPQWSTLSGVAVTTFSAGTTGFTPSTATSGAVTLAGTLATTNGGTGLTSFTANGVVYASSSSALTTGSALTFDGTNLGVGGTSGYETANRTTIAAAGVNSALLGFKVGSISAGYAFADASHVEFGAPTGRYLSWDINGEQMRLTSTSLYTASGINVGIGTSSPGYKLSIAGAAGSAAINLLETSVRSWAIRAGGTATNTFDIADLTAGQTRLTLDSSGNLGLGVTPSAWASGRPTLEFGGSVQPAIAFNGNATNGGAIWTNAYFDGTNRYKANGAASRFDTSGGAFSWFTAPSGTAGNAISFTQAMTLFPSGNFGVGNTGDAYKITAYGATPDIVAFHNGANATRAYISSDNSAAYIGRTYSSSGVPLIFNIGGIGSSGVAQMTLDSSGNLGLGVTPSAWSSLWSAEQFGQAGSLFSYKSGSNYTVISNNSYAAGGNYQGTDARYTNDGYATAYVQNNSGQHLWLNAASGTAGVGVTFTQAMTLDASGNLLVGTTTSATRNITVGTTNASIALAGANGGIYLGATGTPVGSGGFGVNAAIARAGDSNFHISGSVAGDLCIAPEGTKNILFGTSASANSVTERARITSGGDLLVGATSLGAWDTRLTLSSDTGTTKWGVGPYSTATNFVISASASAGVYLAGTTATSWSSVSDERHKDIIEPIANAAEKVCTLRAVIGKYKADETSTRKSFLIAQDVLAVLPEAVDISNPERFGLAYSDMVPLLVAAIQEQQALINDLRARVAQLEAK
jgi:hypothetical protein